MGRNKQELISKGLLPKRREERSTTTADYMECDAKLLQELAAVISHRGGCVRYGYTRDGGTFNIGLYLGDERQTYYPRGSDDVDDYLRDLIRDLQDNVGIPEDPRKR